MFQLSLADGKRIAGDYLNCLLLPRFDALRASHNRGGVCLESCRIRNL